jgi:alpha-methylacyl-CoA racemase
MSQGPLVGVRVIELAGVGPTPFCGMLLADMGAEVLRIDRPELVLSGASHQQEAMSRGKLAVGVDLKCPAGRDLILQLAEQSDVLIEGLRPGATEKLRLGPDDCQNVNEQLVYARITGWGQDGPLAGAAGHDINYIAATGALHAMGYADRPPVPPLSVIGDFAAGGVLTAFGIVCALLERESSGHGQVIDSAMFEGALLLLTGHFERLVGGTWRDTRESNSSDGGYPWYSTYETGDGKYVAIGCLEDQFFHRFCSLAGLDPGQFRDRSDRRNWPQHRDDLRTVFSSRTRDEWADLFEATDACVVPVISLVEAPDHDQAVARGSFSDVAGLRLPSAAPRLSRTPAASAPQIPRPGADGSSALKSCGFDDETISLLVEEGALVLPPGSPVRDGK